MEPANLPLETVIISCCLLPAAANECVFVHSVAVFICFVFVLFVYFLGGGGSFLFWFLKYFRDLVTISHWPLGLVHIGGGAPRKRHCANKGTCYWQLVCSHSMPATSKDLLVKICFYILNELGLGSLQSGTRIGWCQQVDCTRLQFAPGGQGNPMKF